MGGCNREGYRIRPQVLQSEGHETGKRKKRRKKKRKLKNGQKV